jgi:hypothetical protein
MPVMAGYALYESQIRLNKAFSGRKVTLARFYRQ